MKYSKAQISEAIKYWKSELKKMDESNGQEMLTRSRQMLPTLHGMMKQAGIEGGHAMENLIMQMFQSLFNVTASNQALRTKVVKSLEEQFRTAQAISANDHLAYNIAYGSHWLLALYAQTTGIPFDADGDGQPDDLKDTYAEFKKAIDDKIKRKFQEKTNKLNNS